MSGPPWCSGDNDHRHRRTMPPPRPSFTGTVSFPLQVLSNGAIGFEAASRSYRANLFPTGQKLIAPFWNRNDMRNGGHVFYREITSRRRDVKDNGGGEYKRRCRRTDSRARTERDPLSIRQGGEGRVLSARHLAEHAAARGNKAPRRGSLAAVPSILTPYHRLLQNTNTFQAALFVTENGTFANFIYNNIGWTQGAEVSVARENTPR